MTAGGTTPSARGFRLPGPTHPVERVVIGWPTLERIEAWRRHLGAARDAVAIAVRAVAEYTPVLVVAAEREGETAERWIGDGIEVLEVPLDDCWLGDTGPFTLLDRSGRRLAVHCGFNGWGGRAQPHDRDAALGARLAEHLGLETVRAPFVLEGGAISANGSGTALATASAVLDPNRNGPVSPEQAEGWLREWLGVDRVVWLVRGLADDWGTDGHVANLARFCGTDHVVLQATTDAADPDWHNAAAARRQLVGAGLTVTDLDVLPHVQCFDQIVEVPYVNHLVTDEAVFVPLAGAAADHEILDTLGGCYPGRRMVGVPGTLLAYGGGGVRSLACVIPAATSPAPAVPSTTTAPAS